MARRGSGPAELRARHAEVDDAAVVMDAAAAFLAVRPRSVEETRRRLRHHGYRHDLVDEVVGQLLGLGYLDDEAFARSWVESRDRARPRGESALRRELALKGIDRDTVVRVLEERDPPLEARDATADMVAAERLLERRRAALMRVPDERKRRERAYALLARNGFDPETCREAMSLFLAAEGEQS